MDSKTLRPETVHGGDIEGIASSFVAMHFYDTVQGSTVEFTAPHEVLMYVCGITPYDATHLGHAATYITYDVLQRRLIDLGHVVKYVRNITDVDDSILAAARRRGVHYLDLAFGERARFDDDMASLNTLPPWSEPRATGAIPEIRGLIDSTIKAGHAYLADGSVYFDTSSIDDFGTVSNFGLSRMRELSDEWGEHPDDPAKRNPLDFVLWRPSADGEPQWNSRWGLGRPGWHVECSALAMRELGPSIDIHGGGVDLLYPHHECVRAQCESVTGQPFVRYWLHHEMVHLDGHKMSKSLGNLVFVHDLRQRVEPAVIRLALSIHHYRRPWQWSDALLDDAEFRLGRWRVVADSSVPTKVSGNDDSLLDAVRGRVDADLDVPAAIGLIDEAVSNGVDPTRAAALLGIDVSRID